jgi:ADP-heptose:LPS heptosyltransferase/GT2 family glycosyltransferase
MSSPGLNPAATGSPPAPRAALILKTDTLGDLVLFAATLQALRSAWPDTRLVVLIRDGYLDLAPLIAPHIEWLATPLDPFVQGPNEARDELARLRETVSALAPGVVAAATSRRNWLEAALAAAAPATSRRIALGSAESDPFFATQLQLHHGLDPSAVFNEIVDTTGDAQEWERNFRLADALLGRPVPRTRPALHPDPAARRTAVSILQSHAFRPGGYVVCAAAGFANVAIKTWPAERFAAALRHLRDRHGLPALLIGHEAEREHLEQIRRAVAVDPVSEPGGSHAGATRPPVLWLGRGGDLRTLAALIAESALFLGNDTGAMHLAAALDVPIVAVFGGGTWPRFVPAARRSISLVHPLPCFGCGWECAFGDAPCVKAITVGDAVAALDSALASRARDFHEAREVEHLPAVARELMGRAASRYLALHADHRARQRQIEEKQQEIAVLKTTCDEREKLLVTVDGHARALTTHLATARSGQAALEQELAAVRSNHALLEKTLAGLPADAAASAKALNNQAVHLRNLESLLRARELEIAELKASAVNRTAGLHDLEQAKHYGRLLAEKETAIQGLRRATAERDEIIRRLSAEASGLTGALRKLWLGASATVRNTCCRPFHTWLFRKVVEEYWMQIGILRHYAPRALKWDERLPAAASALADARARRIAPDRRVENRGPAAPHIAIVTPSFNQERFLERTMLSVLDQQYPLLHYVVQDGGSTDASPEIIARHATRLLHWESIRDDGQADAIHRGFSRVEAGLGPDAIMAWLNSDDLLAPGALRFVAEYFLRRPEVDVVYGHRIIIDDDDREVGRWIMPRHNPETLEWIDYVPQETLFWRKRAWDLVGGIDPSFHFALDWDLLARFQQAGCRVVRVPYFLGAFRIHAGQKTSQAIHTTGADEMRRIRARFHGERQDDPASIDRHARDARFWGAITARLHEVGIRW